MLIRIFLKKNYKGFDMTSLYLGCNK